MSEQDNGGKFAPAVEMGKRGGASTSAAKAAAARANGRKGGRPRKAGAPPAPPARPVAKRAPAPVVGWEF